MTSYKTGITNRTTSGMVASALFATQILSPQVQAANTETPKRFDIDLRSYELQNRLFTFDQYSNVFTGNFKVNEPNFQESMSAFYANLLSQQKPLPEQIGVALHSNLWDLYSE